MTMRKTIIFFIFIILTSLIHCDEELTMIRQKYYSREYAEVVSLFNSFSGEIDDEYKHHLFFRGISYYHLGNYTESILWLNKSKKFYRKKGLPDKYVKPDLAKCYFKLENLKKCKKLVEGIKLYDMGSPGDYATIAQTYLDLGDLELAHQNLIKGKELNPRYEFGYISVYMQLARYYFLNDKLFEAIIELETGFKLSEGFICHKGSLLAIERTTAMLYLSYLYALTDQYDKAIDRFQKAKEINDLFDDDYDKWFDYREFSDEIIQVLHKISRSSSRPD